VPEGRENVLTPKVGPRAGLEIRSQNDLEARPGLVASAGDRHSMGFLPLEGSARTRVRSGDQTWKDEPQPQVPVTFGLPNLKPEPWVLST
jgi:hypothetical protein